LKSHAYFAQAEKNFGTSKEDLVAQYRFSAEQALAKADFLITTDFAVIQALVIFLVVARRYDTSRFCWSLTGLCIRLAQGMGLHRDGSYFDLTPFETEMRRRVWWAVMKLDMRSSEEFGTDLTIHDRAFDTEVPLNINDSDMSPEGTTPLVARKGPTDMSAHLLRCEITKIARPIMSASSASGQQCPLGTPSAEELERQLMDTYRLRIKPLLDEHQSSMADRHEIFWMAQVITRVVMTKMYLSIYQPVLFSEPEKLPKEARQRIFVSAVELLEADTRLHRDTRAHPFRWLFLTYNTWSPIAYVLVETARRSWTPLTERAWEAVCNYDRAPLEKMKRTDHAAVLLPLRKLSLAVRKHRSEELVRLKKDPAEAKRLEQAERDNEIVPWYGRPANSEERMAEIREKWWSLVRPDESTTLPANVLQPADLFASQNVMPSGQAQPGFNAPGRQVEPLEMSEAQMMYLDQFMSQSGPKVADIYDLNNRNLLGMTGAPILSGDTPDMQTMSFPGDITSPTSNGASSATATNKNAGNTPQGMFPGALNQQSMMQPNDPVPPFMWGGWLDDAAVANGDGVIPDKVMGDAMANEDLNMLDQDFDWQDWQQSLKGLDMWQGGVAPGPR
jgi:hypothetical protein